MKKKETINSIKEFLNTISDKTKIKVELSEKIVLSGYLVKYYAGEILDKETNRHPIDSGILEWSEELIKLLELENYKALSEYKKLVLFLNNYNKIFNQWKLMDKNRTIERIIISYHNRCEHIEVINKDTKIDKEQKMKSLNVLKNEKKELINSIKQIDPKFNINYLEKNYKKIYNELKENWEKIFKQTGNTMKKAYYDMISEELKNGNLKPINDLFIEITERILLITPEKRKESLKKKFSLEKIQEIILYNDWNEDLLKFIDILSDIILMFGAPCDDRENKKWRESIKYIEKYEYATKLPQVLIQMEEKLDRIYQLIAQNNNKIENK